ncbi:hypothetical protein P6F26_04995 [Roseibacterium sp. SDUM158017]|uniref:hypothetical protein n=1 Tax=Roseicyclus salinarum TaxID=3036773 RepID=UPI002414EB78|nr:hypothetical protein [Roseibacterium sp. SDUM158017]MDG4647790.1 hypothetical protein [Roseibacterium sp. SDUM158017]
MGHIRVERATGAKNLYFSLSAQVSDSLGPSPRDSLAALVAYGLNDAEIAEYLGFPRETVTHLRLLWELRDDR